MIPSDLDHPRLAIAEYNRAPMGQLLLGFRSLIVKVVIFVIMAALLAWALGGTLWPRPVVVEFDPVTNGHSEWQWSLSVGGDRSERHHPRVRWKMMVRSGDAALAGGQNRIPFPNEDAPAVFADVAHPVVSEERIAFAGLLSTAPWWEQREESETDRWVLFIARDRDEYEAHVMLDRLAVEQQLARFTAGLPVQRSEVILNQRKAVIDPASSE